MELTPKITVLGSGISGLSTAFFLNRKYPNASITVVERDDRFGGWIKSSKDPKSKRIFEYGPRIFRSMSSNAFPFLSMIYDSGVHQSITVARRKNRYYAKNNRLVPMALLNSQWTVPGIKGLLFKDLNCQPCKENDESVGAFFERHFGPEISHDIAGALMHGIFGGDAYQLSARSIIPNYWSMDQEYGSIAIGSIKRFFSFGKLDDYKSFHKAQQKKLFTDQKDKNKLEFLDLMNTTDSFYLKTGNEDVAKGIVQYLKGEGNVEFVVSQEVISCENKNNQILVKTKDSEFLSDYVFSALPSFALGKVCPSVSELTSKIPYVDIGMVHLSYLFKILPSTLDGYGCLVPPSEKSPLLGITFDSNLYELRAETWLTAMLGGHQFKKYFAKASNVEEAVKESCMREIKRYFQFDNLEPYIINSSVNKQCLPQYLLGHRETVGQITDKIDQEFNGRMKVVGAWVRGVSVIDCCSHAYNAVEGLEDRL